jgi:hypothetical protein
MFPAHHDRKITVSFYVVGKRRRRFFPFFFRRMLKFVRLILLLLFSFTCNIYYAWIGLSCCTYRIVYHERVQTRTASFYVVFSCSA